MTGKSRNWQLCQDAVRGGTILMAHGHLGPSHTGFIDSLPSGKFHARIVNQECGDTIWAQEYEDRRRAVGELDEAMKSFGF